MLFPTVDFAVFFLIVFTGSWLLRPYPKPWRWFILLSGCVFYLDPFNTKHSFFVLVPFLMIVGMALLGSVAQRAVAPDGADSGSNRSWWAFTIPLALFSVYTAGNVHLTRTFIEKPDLGWIWLFLLLGMAFVNQAFAKAAFATMGEARARTAMSRWLVRLAVAADLSVLAFFKYWDFFVSPAHDLFANFGAEIPLSVLNLALPIAISFFTFQAISYVVDVGRGEIRPVPLLDFVVYLSFFAHIVAGPIVRVGEFVPQLYQKADPRFVQSGEAFMLIFRGMFKKVVVSSFLATNLVDPVFGPSGGHVPGGVGQLQAVLGILGYAIQIYADFSGYTDIAIGVALLVGIRFPQNFDAPYRALSIQDFWRRWHMTLSRWLRDYLYIPLGGNRKGVERTYFNLWATMLLGGLWHGANWTFVLWGAIHGTALGAERFVKTAWAKREKPLGVPAAVVAPLQWLLTFTIVCAAWVFFRAATAGDAIEVFKLALTGSVTEPIATAQVRTLQIGAAVIALAVLSQFVPPRIPERITFSFARLAPALQMAALAAGFILVDALGPEGIAPFIYFQF